MSHYLLELVLWMLLAFFIGCIFGYLLRNMIGGTESAVAEGGATGRRQPHVAAPIAPKAAAAVMSTGKMERPKGISTARDGKARQAPENQRRWPKERKGAAQSRFFPF